MKFSVTFADDIAIPIRNVDDEIACAAGNALTTETAARCQPWSKRKFLFFSVGHLGNRVEAFPYNAMAGRARTDATARMIDVNTMRQRDIQNAARQSRVAIRNFFGINIHADIHWKKCDRKLLCRRNSRFLVNVRIRTTHSVMVPRFGFVESRIRLL